MVGNPRVGFQERLQFSAFCVVYVFFCSGVSLVVCLCFDMFCEIWGVCEAYPSSYLPKVAEIESQTLPVSTSKSLTLAVHGLLGLM